MFLNPIIPGAYSIGVDPGKNTGFAVFSIFENRLIRVECMTFWTAYHAILGAYNPEALTRVVVEVPDTKHVWHNAPRDIKAIQRQGVNVGGVIREAELFADGLDLFGYPVVRVPPRKKVDAARFAAYTGWDKRTNQHARDAAMLCYGR